MKLSDLLSIIFFYHGYINEVTREILKIKVGDISSNIHQSYNFDKLILYTFVTSCSYTRICDFIKIYVV